MKIPMYSIVFVLIFLMPQMNSAQVAVDYNVNVDNITHQISPYIYGANGQQRTGITASRSGGNRLTGYSWETNYSNAGEDYIHHSDDYLPYILNIPDSLYDVPGIVLTDFVEKCNQNNQYALVTLPMAGYVAADGDGVVAESETAPSARWHEVVLVSPIASTEPNLDDSVIYVDQEIQFLIDRCGSSLDPNGIKGYSLDNEPALWPYTHPRIHPEVTSVAELLDKSINLSSLIKDMDSDAETFGPAVYGFYAMYNLQDASDWSNYQANYPTFLDAYLGEMNTASSNYGQRLLDVLDVHWYPEPEGVYAGATDDLSAMRRMQAPRSLWDETYTEESWIADALGEPIAMIKRWKTSVDTYFPNTKIGITEYDYGAPNHISGGIAQIEALGAFAQENIYFASKWNAVNGFIGSGYDMFINLDGQGKTFGTDYLESSSSEINQSSIFSSKNPSNDEVHLVITNRSLSDEINGDVQINYSNPAMPKIYDQADVYQLTSQDTLIQYIGNVQLVNNRLQLDIPASTAVHIIAKPKASKTTNLDIENGINVYPTIINKDAVNVEVNHLENLYLKVCDVQGREMIEQPIQSTKTVVSTRKWNAGFYILSVQDVSGNTIATEKILKK